MLPAVAEKLGVTFKADSGPAQEPLYQVQPVGAPPVNPIIGGNGALPMHGSWPIASCRTRKRRAAARAISRSCCRTA